MKTKETHHILSTFAGAHPMQVKESNPHSPSQAAPLAGAFKASLQTTGVPRRGTRLTDALGHGWLHFRGVRLLSHGRTMSSRTSLRIEQGQDIRVAENMSVDLVEDLSPQGRRE